MICADRPGLRGAAQVARIEARVTSCLQAQVSRNHPSEQATFAKLIVKLSELRLLNTVHSERLLGQLLK